MIIKNFEIKKINLNKNPIVLFYGKNEGFKTQVKDELLRDKFITSHYEEREIIDNKNNFIESIYTKSLFENEKIIFINRVTDKILEVISIIINKKIEDLIIIINAENLEKKSKLRSFFEKHEKCVCIPFYPDTNQTLSKIAYDDLRKENIIISQSDLNLIINKCNGDRKILFTELEKIKLYAKDGKKINRETISKLTNLIENHSITELVNCCLVKNKDKIINILAENNFNNEEGVLITRVFLNKLKMILKLSIEYEKNNNLDLTISSAKPPIFWKEKEITKQQILNWSPKKIKNLLYRINNTELLLKKNYGNSINLITDFILNQTSIETNSLI
mgnify:CR=1 FL=1|tara:strand:- start:56 stop:1054 length:999 start_codon:yes stop_codon:yes gene_type:complete